MRDNLSPGRDLLQTLVGEVRLTVGARIALPMLLSVDLDPCVLDEGDHVSMLYARHVVESGEWGVRWGRRRGLRGEPMVELPDATLGPSFEKAARRFDGFKGWWPGRGIRLADGTITCLVHVEFGYMPSTGSAHSRELFVAASNDNGETWSLDGLILSADADRSGRPADDWVDFGAGDPKLIVDDRSGYHYLYYMDGWVSRTGDLSSLAMKVARSPISEDLRRGTWSKWFRGTWDEPAIGGHDDPVWSTPRGVGNGSRSGSQPMIFFSESLDQFVALAPDWISFATDLEAQDWSVPASFGDDLGGWYTWVGDRSRTRDVVGDEFERYAVRTTQEAWVQKVRLEWTRPAETPTR